MDRQQSILEQTRLLAQRLERIYVDSIWARRSSGHRGNLLKWIEQLEQNAATGKEISAHELERLQTLLEAGYAFLEKAAQERLKK
jgi:hypothetical protein